MTVESNGREQWSGNLGFILAAAGSAIGLGNIWKFPYITGENGGGAFVLVYLICVTVIGLPVMLCEIALGRHTQRNPVGAFQQLSPKSSKVAHLIGLAVLLTGAFLLCFRNWGAGVVALVLGMFIFRFGWILVGAMGVVAGFMILSFYSVVAGWTSPRLPHRRLRRKPSTSNRGTSDDPRYLADMRRRLEGDANSHYCICCSAVSLA